MKKSNLLSTALVVLFGLLSINSFAQDKKNVIKANLFGALVGQYQLAYERVLNSKSSFQLSAGVVSRTGSQTMFENSYKSNTSGFIIIPEYRYYLTHNNKDVPRGFYLAPFARVLVTNSKLTDTSLEKSPDVSRKEKVSALGGGLVLGYQVLMGGVVSLDLSVGPQYKSRSSSITYNEAGVTENDFDSKFASFKIQDKAGVGLRFAVGLGVAF